MELITLDSNAFKAIMAKLEEMEKLFKETRNKAASPLSEIWLDNQDVCLLLNISKRTLQSYRDNGLIPYARINSKVYYKASDVEKFLIKHYQKPKNF